MNHKTLLTISIISAGCAFSTTTFAGPQKGDAVQRLCVKLENEAPVNLRVITDQWTDDTNNSGNNPNPPKDYSDEFLINKGDIGIHCSEIMATARIKGEGKVGFSFRVQERDDPVDIDSIDSSNFFHGGGQNNKWDLDGKERCNDGRLEPGIHLDVTDKNNRNYMDCSPHDGIPDNFQATVYFTPDLSNVDDGGSDGGNHENPTTYREYSAEDVDNGNSDYKINERVWQPVTGWVYQCTDGGWCNQASDAYSPGTGKDWTDAWVAVDESEWDYAK